MNLFIFDKLFNTEAVNDALASSAESTDDIGVVLRLHLITESFLEAFICSGIKIEGLFDTKPKKGKAFKLNYSKKLDLAVRLGLPLSAFKALEALNNIRNNLAHRIQNDSIQNNTIESLFSHVSSIGGKEKVDLSEEGFQSVDKDGSVRAVYYLKDAETPNRIKLIILVWSLIRRTTGEMLGFYEVCSFCQTQ